MLKMCDISLADTTAIMSNSLGVYSRKGQLRVAVLVSGLFLFQRRMPDIASKRRNAKTTQPELLEGYIGFYPERDEGRVISV